MIDALLHTVDVRGVATLTLNRPQLHNAFDDRLIADLTRVLEQVGADRAVRVVVLRGAGRSFSAGADLDWMRRMAAYGFDENLRDAAGLARLMQVLDRLPKPTIALVQGAAYGGGVGLVACCDIALAAETACFCLSEVKLGLIPAVISPYVVAAIGVRQARRYALTAEVMTAAKAEAIGLVHEQGPIDQLDASLERIIEALLLGGPEAETETKDLLHHVALHPIDDALVAETGRRIALRRSSDEGRDGVMAFLDKRLPAWRQSPL